MSNAADSRVVVLGMDAWTWITDLLSDEARVHEETAREYEDRDPVIAGNNADRAQEARRLVEVINDQTAMPEDLNCSITMMSRGDLQIITEALEMLEEERRLTAQDRMAEGEPNLHASHIAVSDRARVIRERLEGSAN